MLKAFVITVTVRKVIISLIHFISNLLLTWENMSAVKKKCTIKVIEIKYTIEIIERKNNIENDRNEKIQCQILFRKIIQPMCWNFVFNIIDSSNCTETSDCW